MHPLHLQMGRLVLIAGTALAATAARSRAAETVQLTPQRDNTIYENCSVPCPDGGSNGSGENVFAGRSGMLGLRRALLRFDVASAVPSGATVLGADLTVHVSSPAPGAPPVSVALHRLDCPAAEERCRPRGTRPGSFAFLTPRPGPVLEPQGISSRCPAPQFR
jgi:hypothetical protein